MDNEFRLERFKKWAEEQGIDGKKLTHGETYALRHQYNLELISNGGKFDDRVNPDINLPPRMGRAEAVCYYNNKLDAYWSKYLSEKIPKRFRLKALNVLTGRVA